jgi:phage-related tail fiber protein
MSYYALITTLGAQRLAEAQYAGVPLVFTDFAVGDGDGAAITPAVGMTALVNEVYSGSVNDVQIYESAASTIRVEGHIPSSEGGFTIREVGLYNAAGELIVIASYPETYKANPAEGATVETYVRVLIEYASVEAVELTTDPAVVTASQEYVDKSTANRLWLFENFT